MSFNFNKVIVDDGISGKTINNEILTDFKLKDGIKKDSDFKSKNINSLLLKLSNSINFIQKNSIVSYILGKKYNLNSIISVVYKDQNNNSIPTLLICVGTNDNINNICDIPPSRNYEVDNNGNIVFLDSNWAELYWKEIPKNSTSNLSLEVDDFEYNFTRNPNSRNDLQAKHIELIDFSSVADSTYSYVNFNITINRYSNLFMTCTFSGNSKNVKFTIDTINNIKNAHLEADGSIWNSKCIFKNVALNGMFFTVDEENAKLYLTYIGNDTMNNAKFNVNVSINKSNTNIDIKKASIATFIDNDKIVIVPFTKGSSNVFASSTLQLFDYAYSLSNKEQFINGLVPLTTEETFDKFVYPICAKINTESGAWDGKVYNLDGKYKYITDESDRYYNAAFPNLIGSPKTSLRYNFPCSGCFTTDSNSYLTKANTGNLYGVILDVNTSRKSTSPNYSKHDWGRNKFIYKTLDPNTGNVTDWTLYPNTLGGDKIFNSDTSEPNRLTVQSFKIIPYIKLW